MDLYNVRIDSGLYSTPYVSGQEIIETEVKNKDIPYFYKTRKKPLEFQLTFSTLDKKFTEQKRYQIARWLIQREYKEFQTTDYLGKIFNVIAISDVDFISGGTKEGYFQVTFRCDAPWAWSPTYVNNFDLKNNTDKIIIELENKSNAVKYYYPEIEFKMQGDTDIELRNLSDGGKSFNFTNILDDEIIYVNNDMRQVISNTGQYRLGNFNKGWLRLVHGINRIEVTGRCKIQTRMRFPLYI